MTRIRSAPGRLPGTQNDERTPVVLDTDIGTDVDDMFALVMAATDPSLELLAVTTVNGDTRLRARIAMTVLKLLGREDVPVAAGASIGLSGIPHQGMPTRFGHEGQGLSLPDALPPLAETVLVDVLERAARPVTICCLGALTNVASLLCNRPDLLPRIARIILMGGAFGAVRAHGSSTAAKGFPEHNLSCDPLAVHTLLAHPVDVLVIPLDVTVRMTLRRFQRADLRSAGAIGKLLEDQLGRFLTALVARRTAAGLPSGPALACLHDVVPVLALSHPEWLTFAPLRVTVQGGPGHVVSLADNRGRLVTCATDLDPSALIDHVLNRIGELDSSLARTEHKDA